jgi:hypothetical protein
MRGAPVREPAGRLRMSVSSYDVSSHGVNDACAALFLGEVERRGLPWVERIEAPRANAVLSELPSLGRVELSWRGPDYHDAFVTLDGSRSLLALVTSHHGTVEVIVAGHDGDSVHEAATALVGQLRSEVPPNDEVTVRFWSSGPHGGNATRRTIDAPDWAEIGSNYTRTARAEVDRLLAMRAPSGGSLILWHGPPGTGKSHALRALAREWRDWCTTHYVTDPERFLGTGTRYLMEVATFDSCADGEPKDPWRLIVLEDAGELMAVNARAKAGQDLSRLLNMTDGLLGQGARCLLLVTTNEPLGRLHPAVRRPGRCLSLAEFGPLSAGEANAWLVARGVDLAVERPVTLAELFARVEDRPVPGEDGDAGAASGFGFGRALRRDFTHDG